MSEQRLKALIIAEAANPEWVSVPLVGWSHARALLDVCDGHLVTQVRNREAIERTGLIEGTHFTAIDSEAVARPMWRLNNMLRGGAGLGWTTGTALSIVSYAYFERLVWKRFGDRIRAGEFDVVHRITPLSPTIPSRLAHRCARAGVPFVLGPLNGGAPWPKGFDGARRREREWLSYVRGMHRLAPGYRSTRRHAKAILIGSRHTWSQMPDRYHDKCIYMPENGIDPQRFSARRERRAERPIRLISAGRLVPYKGADMFLEAAAPLVRDGSCVVEIVGDGPMRSELKAMASREKIERDVRFTGWIKHHEVQQRLADSDVFCFPSIREFGGAVALEAMAVGLPPMVVDYAGPAELVNDSTGWLVPLGTRSEIVAGFRSAIEGIVSDPSVIDRKSAAGLELVRTRYTWDVKARMTLQALEWAAGKRRSKPDFERETPPVELKNDAAVTV